MDKHLQTEYGHAYHVFNSMRDDMNRVSLWGLLVAGLFADPADAQVATATATGSGQRPGWSYVGGANNDEDWGSLSPDYAACTLGSAQSPIAIDETKPSMLSAIRIAYKPSKIIAQLREQTLILQFMNEKNHLSHEGTDYILKQVRLHTPSEHSITGQSYPMELHLIHQAKDAQTLIVAVMVEQGDELTGLAPLFAKLPSREHRQTELNFDVNTLLTDPTRYYAYEGSLSWPPCLEGVQWRIFKDTLKMSRDQLQTLSRLTGRNSRVLQPRYFREVKETRN